MQKRDGFVLFMLLAVLVACGFGWFDAVLGTTLAHQLPYFEFRTLVRMFAALIISLLVGIPVGLLIVMKQRFGKVVLPIVDVLQSIPVLGYVPPLILLIGVSSGVKQEFELELVAMLLLVTGMVWAIIFNTLSGYDAIPDGLKDAMRSLRLSRVRLLQHLVLPALYSAVTTGGLTAMGGGWYFLVAAEYITYGEHHSLELPGIGSFLTKMTYESGNIFASIFGLGLLVATVYVINRLVWRPLIEYSVQFKYEGVGDEVMPKGRLVTLLEFLYAVMMRAWAMIEDTIFNSTGYRLIKKVASVFLLLVFFVVVGMYARDAVNSVADFVVSMYAAFGQMITLSQLLYFSVRSLVRLMIAYAVALSMSVLVCMLVWRSKKVYEFLLPLFDIFQSVPALALFPVIIYSSVQLFHHSSFAIEVASIVLLLTGMLWYILFNLMSAVNAVPKDLVEAGRAYGLKGNALFFKIILPASYPRLVVASMQAFGGGWNASIVSEYIRFGSKILTVDGLGMLLDKASFEYGSAALVAIALVMLVGIIVVMNWVVWKPLLNRVEVYRVV